MERLEYNSCEDLALHIDDVFTEHILGNDKYGSISIIARYDEMKEIVAEFIALGYNITDVELSAPFIKGYSDEYVCSIDATPGHKQVWCESMLIEDGKYLGVESDITYILDNCSSKVIKSVTADFVYEVCILDDEDIEDKDIKGCNECSARFECEDSTAKNTKVTESKPETKGVYKVNGKAVSKKEFDAVVEGIEDEYYDSLKKFLLSWCSIQDELNSWRRVFY
jgi:hypothetical protein